MAVDFELFKVAVSLKLGLDWLLKPIDLADFFARYWEKEPLLLQRENSEYYNELFSLKDIDYVISCTDLRFPAARMVKEGANLPVSAYAEDVVWGSDTYYGTIIPEKLYKQYQEGASVVFQALHRSWKPLNLFCRELEKYFRHHVQTNLYLTPKAAQGFKPHYDTHDVFILQIAGRKHWKIYEPPLNLPHRSQPSNNAQLLKEPGKLIMEFDLKAGDLLYLPRGYVHEALTSESESLHITLGITAFTYIEVLNEIINEALQSLKQEELFRRSLPVGFIGSENLDVSIKARFLEIVTQQIENSNLEAVAAKLARRFVNNQTAMLEGHLLELARLEDLQPGQTVCQRPGNIYRFFEDKESNLVKLEFNQKTISFPDYVKPSLEFILSQDEQSFQIAEIGGLDTPGKVTLVKRLIIEGFLRLADLPLTSPQI